MSNIIDSIRMSGTTYAISDSGGTKVVEITQSDYDNLPTSAKTANIMYVITDAEPFDVSNYYQKSETSGATELATAFAATQPKLSAGTNITIDANNVISAEGGGGKAVSGGTNISITTGETADTINCTLPISADSKGIYTTSTYPFYSTSNKSGNVVFGYNNKLDTFGSSKSSNYNLFFGSTNSISTNGSGMLIGGLNNNDLNGNYSDRSACVVLGAYNAVKNPYEFVSGKYSQTYYNSQDFGGSGNTLFSVGNGISTSARHSAFEVRQNGDIYIVDTNDTSTSYYYQKPMIKLQDVIGGSSYSAGTGIDITNNVISVSGVVETSAITTSITSSSTDVQVPSAKAVNDKLGGLSIVKLTQTEYDNLSTKDSNTLYVIVN